MSAGSFPRSAPEWRTFTDPETGTPVRQLTAAAADHCPLPARHASVTPDGRTLLFLSDRSGPPNLFAVSLEDGEIRQVTDVEDMDPDSPALAPDGARVYYTAGEEIRTVYLAAEEEEVLAGFPGAELGNATVSADGGWVATRVRRDDRNAIVAVHTGGATGSGAATIVETEREIGAVQFAPSTDNALLYSGDPYHRIWLVRFDGSYDRCLVPQSEGEWLAGETWLGPEEILYLRWPHLLRAAGRDGSVREIASFYAWSPAARRDGSLIVCDTLLPDRGIVLVDPATGDRRPLCFPEDPADPTGARPRRPSFTPDGARVLFSAPSGGRAHLFVAEVG
jgi:Tol biopolymer transport system component